ncbi:MAG: hypothetical protein HYU86_09430 [Chloroflexi bacterium]|nr:hypothetical protein [Chloroflexota bacterium]
MPNLAQGSPQEKTLRDELLADHLALRDSFIAFLGLNREGIASEDFFRNCRDTMYRLLVHAKKEDIYLLPMMRKLLHVEEMEPLPEHAPPILYEEEV